jgi:hypothetical protein
MNYGPPLPIAGRINNLNTRIAQLDAHIERLERIEQQLAEDLYFDPLEQTEDPFHLDGYEARPIYEPVEIDDSSEEGEVNNDPFHLDGYEFEYMVGSDDDETIVNYTEHAMEEDDDSDTDTVVGDWVDPFGTPEFLRRRG